MTGESCQISLVDNLQSSPFLYASTCSNTFLGLFSTPPSMQQSASLDVVRAHHSLPVPNFQHTSLDALARRPPGNSQQEHSLNTERPQLRQQASLIQLLGISTLSPHPCSTKQDRKKNQSHRFAVPCTFPQH
ncbi:hypothetical protein CDL15_Pgr006395 [Punica granatum]|uniref:Uncharacterized protein n=1 Tax=Punica granatum TaxID=22663 RepID=A0A218VU54_PUNGR|nr:hypothetical protein CDL15_Pgr006395 [Punica granatum]